MWVNLLLKALLFILLVPGVHLNFPGTLLEKSLIAGLFFAVLNWVAYKVIRPMLESFKNPDSRVDQPCPSGYIKCASGDCRLKSDVHSPCG
jgi:hypothetical protein